MVFRLVEKIFDNEGITGLKNRTKCGRHSALSEETSYKIKTIKGKQSGLDDKAN